MLEEIKNCFYRSVEMGECQLRFLPCFVNNTLAWLQVFRAIQAAKVTVARK